MATKPTFVGAYGPANNWINKSNTNSPVSTSSISVLAGDRLVVKLYCEDQSFGPSGNPTSSGITFTSQANATNANYPRVRLWTANISSDASITVSFTPDNASYQWGFLVEVWRNSSGFGAVYAGVNSGAPNVSLTTTGDNSAISAIIGDWNGTTGSRTWRTINSVTPSSGNGLELGVDQDSSHGSVYVAYWDDVGAAGSKSLGMSNPSGQKGKIAAIEVLGSSGNVTGSSSMSEANDTISSSGSISMPEETLFDGEVPSSTDSDPGDANLGMVVVFDKPGLVKGIMVYHANNTPADTTVSFYTNDARDHGNLDASANGSASGGWSRIDFDTPVPVNANTPYTVSHWHLGSISTPQVHFTSGRFSSAVVNGSISGPANGNTTYFDNDPCHNGRYWYSSSPAYPASNGGAVWYGVDVVFQSYLPIEGQLIVTEANDTSSSTGTGPEEDETYNLFGSETPATGADDDDVAITFGTIFAFYEPGFVKGVRVYRADGTENITVGLYDMTSKTTGNLLASKAGTSGSGWTTINFDTPVAVDANVPYIAVYYRPGGAGATPRYYVSPNRLAEEISSTYIRSISSGSAEFYTDIGNGRYIYNSGISFPVSKFGDTWYGVDVEFFLEGEPSDDILGAASITEASDTISSTSAIIIKGVSTTTEANDTISSTGGIRVKADASITEASDAISSTSKINIVASASLTEGPDTVTSASKINISGSLAATEANDTVISNSGSSVFAGASISEANDDISSTGLIYIKSNTNITEANDDFVSDGVIIIRGTAPIVESNDTLSTDGGIDNQGILTQTETNDFVTAVSSAIIKGILSVSEANDNISSTGLFAALAQLTRTEEDDIFAGNAIGRLRVGGIVNRVENNDLSSATASKEMWGVSTLTEADDTVFSFTLVLSNPVANANITEGNDTLSSVGQVLTHGAAETVETNDSVSSASKLFIKGITTTSDDNDSVSFESVIFIKGDTARTEANDVLTGLVSTNIVGAANITENDDALNVVGFMSQTSIVTATEDDDSVSTATRVLIRAINNTSEDNDTVEADSFTNTRGILINLEDSDVISVFGSSTRSGTTTAVEANDTIYTFGAKKTRGEFSLEEFNDTVVSSTSLSYVLVSNNLEENDVIEAQSGLRYRVGEKQIITAQKQKPFFTVWMS